VGARAGGDGMALAWGRRAHELAGAGGARLRRLETQGVADHATRVHPRILSPLLVVQWPDLGVLHLGIIC
jgi:hypothetical protein